MKSMITALLVGLSFAAAPVAAAQNRQIESGVYHWTDMILNVNEGQEYASVEMFKGSALGMDELVVRQYVAEAGADIFTETIYPGTEVMIIVKEGILNVTAGGESDAIGPGSVALVMAGDMFTVIPEGDTPSAFYTFNYKNNTPADRIRGEESDGSVIVNFDELEFNPHDRGGQWQYMNRPTSVLGRLDIHVTSLNAGIKSHEPHTHRAPEIVLMIENESQMEIGDGLYQGTDGDLFFLESEIPHALENIGEESTRYFAIQWSD